MGREGKGREEEGRGRGGKGREKGGEGREGSNLKSKQGLGDLS